MIDDGASKRLGGAAYPSGKGEVCKTSMHRFESDRRLQFPNKDKGFSESFEMALLLLVCECAQRFSQSGKWDLLLL
jgi:hypothetical protein